MAGAGDAGPALTPRVIGRVGRTPKAAADVEVRPNADGTLTPYMEGQPLLDYDSAEPIVVPAESTDREIADAIERAGAIGGKSKFYGVADGPAPDAAAPGTATPSAPPSAAAPGAAAPSAARFEPPAGVTPGAPAYEAAFEAWVQQQQSSRAANDRARQRAENQTAIDKRNAWRKRVRDWFIAANDGDTITDTGTGTTYKVVVKKRKATGQTIKLLAAVDDQGNPLPDGRSATGISIVDGRVDGLDDASLDQDTGSTTPETAGASLAGNLGRLLESGEAVVSSSTTTPSVAAPFVAEAGAAAPSTAPADESDQDRSNREWGENYSRVTGAADLGTISTVDLERAEAFGSRIAQSEKRKGWDGGAVNKELVEGVEREIGFIQAELKKRRAAAESPPAPAAEFKPRAGDKLKLDGKDWTVDKVTPKAVTLTGTDGKKKRVELGGPTWKKLAEQNPVAPAQTMAEIMAGAPDAAATPAQPAVDAESAAPAPAAAPGAKPRLAEAPDTLLGKLKMLAGGYVDSGGGRGILPVYARNPAGGPTYAVGPGGKVTIIEDGGRATRDGTAAEVNEFHNDLEADRLWVHAYSRWGGSGGDKATSSRPLVELHSPSGLSWQGKTAPASPVADELRAFRERRAAQREAERRVYREIEADPAMVGKSVDELAAEVARRTAEDKLKDGQVRLLARALHKTLARKAAELAKAKHRSPAVRAAAVAEAVGNHFPDADVPPAQHGAFLAGFDHAMAGKTKSTLAGEFLPDRLAGYEAAMAWRDTEEGAAFYEGRAVNKLQNTGLDLKRWFDKLREQMKADEPDIQKAWKQIERATARSDLFRPLLPDGMKPGHKAYIEAVRDGTATFRQWLDNDRLHDWLGAQHYRGRYSDAKSNLEYILTGERYPGKLTQEDREKFRSDDAYRAQWLRDQAEQYTAAVRGFIELFEGRAGVREAAEKFSERYVVSESPVGTNTWSEKVTLNAAGQALQASAAWAGDKSWFTRLRINSAWTQALIEKEDKLQLAGRATPLTPPRLDRVTRDGATVRGDKDVTPADFKAKFGMADVGFGTWVGARQDQDHLNYSHDAFADLARHFGIGAEAIGFGGKLHFTIGALGHGKHAAHFSPNQPSPVGPVQVINVTNTKGDGTVYHEWAHALDHNLGGDWERVRGRLLGYFKNGVLTPKGVERRADDFLFGGYGWKGAGKDPDKIDSALRAMRRMDVLLKGTAYKSNADQLGKDYWGNDHELFARAVEAWAADSLGHTNTYLVNPEWVGDGKVTKDKGYRGTPYPTGEERRLFGLALDALRKAVKWEGGRPTVKMADFEAALPDELTAGEKRRFELAERSGMERYKAQRDAERADAAAAKAQEAAEAKRREQEEMDQLAQAELEKLQPVIDSPPPSQTSGPLTEEDLSAIFDEAAAELREETQEQPDVPPPGELGPRPVPAGAPDGAPSTADAVLLRQRIIDDDIVLFAGTDWARRMGLPTIQDMGNVGAVEHMGFGTFRVTSDAVEANWTAGGSMSQTPDGLSYTVVSVTRGRMPYPRARVLDALDAVAGLVDDGKRLKTGAELMDEKIRASADKRKAEAASAQDKHAAALIAEAAKLGVKGADEALTGLAKLFGKPGQLNSFPGGFDEDTYRQAKPHFQAALKNFQDAGKTLKDLFKLLIQQFGDGIKEYAVRFAADAKLTASLGTEATPTMTLATWVKAELGTGKPFDWRALFEQADRAFGGTQAEGRYTPKDAYDAMESGVNQYILANAGAFTPNVGRDNAMLAVAALQNLVAKLPTQTKRTGEQDAMQQFSTVPPFAFVANWVAGVRETDTMAETSAGIGGLAVFAKLAGAKLVLNELSSRRASVLQEVFPGTKVWQENAEQIHNIWPDEIRPTVAVINPPFSASVATGRKSTSVGAEHLEQAMLRLVNNGRLVAIVGEGMGMDKPAFRDWWKKMQAKYDVRAVVPVDGSGYAKYGTTFDNVLVVIDKRKAPADRQPITTKADSHDQLIGMLAGVRDDRPQPIVVLDGSESQPDPDRGARGPAADAGGGQARPGQPGAGGADGVGGRAPLQQQPAGRDGAGRDGQGGAGSAAGGVRQPGRRPDAAGDDAARGRGDAGGQPSEGTGLSVGSVTAAAGELTDSIFEGYQPQRLQVPGAQPHPGALVQSAAMASVLPPAATYVPNLPKEAVEKGLLSIAQIESVVYAGQAHEQVLEQKVSDTEARDFGLKAGTAYRRGFFIGDGTGVGKGREISGILLDNLRRGRKKHVWISEKQGLMADAKRDFKGVGGDNGLVFNQNDAKADDSIVKSGGIVYTTYATLRSGSASPDDGKLSNKGLLARFPKDTELVAMSGRRYYVESFNVAKGVVKAKYSRYAPRALEIAFENVESIDGRTDWAVPPAPTKTKKTAGKSRVDQLVEWLGPDFDGVIAFDEAHNAGNAVAVKGTRGTSDPSAQALAVVELQRRLPGARVVYVSATGATEVANLSFANRLGLWGPGTPFPTVQSFVDQMTAGGLATMELVARDMKQTGSYLARSLSYDGVTYSRVEHELTGLQRDIYDKMAEAWQVVLRNMLAALDMTGARNPDTGKAKNSKAVAAAKSAFWGAQQRFFSQIITSMQMPTVLEAIERDLAGGDAVLLQLVNTNEAQQERALAKSKKGKDDGEPGDELEDLDLTPRDQLIQMVEKSFPVQQMEDVRDPDTGKITSQPVVDSEGKPVLNKDAVKLRDKLIQDLQQISVPDGPLEIILNHFGPDITAEVTGRKQRVVRKPDDKGEIRAQIEKRGGAAARADADAFMADKKRILIFSDAGGTGFSFHADRTKKNQRKRKHYLIQPGWRANKAVQGLGRSHRTNQASAPHYTLAATNVPAHKRFLSSIARRLDQLGALTKGQRDTSSGGLFSEKDNLESKYAAQAVRRLLDGAKTGTIPGLKFDEFLTQLGLEDIVNPDTGQIAETKYPETRTFLNRMLSLKLDMQDVAFSAFTALMEEQIEIAAERGELDTGMQTIRALSSKVVNEEIVYTEERTGAETRYVELELTHPTRMYSFPDEKAQGAKIEWVVNVKSGRVWGKVRSGNTTMRDGAVVPRFRMLGTGGTQIRTERDFAEAAAWRAIDASQAQALWDKETAARPPTYTDKAHMIVGAMLPIWDRLKTDGVMQVARTQTEDGRRLLGRLIAQKDVGELLKRLNIQSPESRLPPAQIMARVLKGEIGVLANGWKLERARVSDELRIELKMRTSFQAQVTEMKDLGAIVERIGWHERVFVPVGKPDVLAAILKNKPLVSLADPNAASTEGETPAFQRSATPYNVGDAGGARDDTRPGAVQAVGVLDRAIGRHVGDASVHPYVARFVPGDEAIRSVAAALGTRVQWFGLREVLTPAQRRKFGFFNGVYFDGTIYLRDAGGDRPHLAVLGHELVHRMKATRPTLYKRFLEEVRPLVDQARYAEFVRTSSVVKDVKGADAIREEFLGEVMADAFMDRGFWRALADKNPSVFGRVVKMLHQLIDAVLKAVGYTPRTARILTDFRRVMDIAADVMAEYADAGGAAAASELRFAAQEAVPHPALAALSNLDRLFKLPKPTAKSINEIAFDVDPAIKVLRVEPVTGQSARWRLDMPDGGHAYVAVRKPNPYGSTLYGFDLDDEGEMVNVVTERPGKNPDDVPPDTQDVILDVSKMKTGTGGDKAYLIAGALAHNTGRIFIGDPAGLTDAALRRRSEQMLSMALKYGTTQFLAPHPYQVRGSKKLGVPPLEWVYGDDAGNVERLIALNVAAAENALPALSKLDFDVTTGQFVNTVTGRPIPGDSVIGVGGRRRQEGVGAFQAAQAGGRTLARAAVLRAVLREARGTGEGRDGGRPDVLGILGRAAAEMPARLFYQRAAGDGEPGAAVDGGLPLFQRSNPNHTPEQTAALAKAGIAGPRSMREKVRAYYGAALQMVSNRNHLAHTVRQGALDQFHGIRQAVRRELGNLPVEQDPYIAARLANGGTSSVMRALMLHGQARWTRDHQHLEKIPGTRGLLDILAPLGDDLNDWFGWMVGNRAERLLKEGRENNLTAADIKALKALATPDKVRKFQAAAIEYAAFKRSVLDVAQSAGLIDPEGRKVWDHADYIPFYREIDERAVFSATGKKGLSGQSSGIRKLKGGTAALNDPMENLLMNFSRLIDASLKNNAILKTVRALEQVKGQDTIKKIGYDFRPAIIPREQIRQALVDAGTPPDVLDALPEDVFEGMAKVWQIQQPTDPDVIRVMVGGKPKFYRVRDAMLLRSLTSFVPFDFPGLALMRGAKTLLTKLVTATPEFMVRNFIRDSVAAQAIARQGFNPWGSIKGIAKSFNETGGFENMLFAGASFQAGQYAAHDPEGAAVAMRRALRAKGMSASGVDAFMATVIDTPAKLWDRYRRAGEAIENANREAVYEAAIRSGKTVTQAAYQAKDLMDFSLRGSWPAYQLLADVIPFLNARVQGLYRLGRSDPKRLMRVGGLILVASLLLAAMNDGEDWYEELPDWDKDTYWHFMIAGQHLRIPKPFEIGVIFATLPERIGRAIKGRDDGGKLMERAWANARDQLAFDPVPQLIRPTLNVWANRDTFRDAPIENMGDEAKLPAARHDARTSDTARVVLGAVEPVANYTGLSPKRLEYLIGGYFGTVGLYALGASDMLVRALEGAPDRPALRSDDIPLVRTFVRADPARGTVFESDLWKMRQEVDAIKRTIQAQAKSGDVAGAEARLAENRDKLAAAGPVIGATEAISQLNKARDRIYADRKLTPAEKRAKLDELQRKRNAIAKKAATNPKVREAF